MSICVNNNQAESTAMERAANCDSDNCLPRMEISSVDKRELDAVKNSDKI